MSIHFSFATREDGDGILKIMEGDAAKGDIQLFYTRRPNPVDSMLLESDKTVIGVFKKNDDIVGTIAGIPRKMYIDGKPQTVCYVTNMKKLEDFKGNINWIQAFNEMYDPLDSSVYYCSVVKENTGVLAMLQKKRPWLPYAVDMDGYRTYIISTTAKVKNPCEDLKFRRAEDSDEVALLQFLESQAREKSFFPVIERFGSGDLPKVTDFYILTDGDVIMAAGALWDRSDIKQYVVQSYSGRVAALRVLNPLISRLGYIRIPKEGSRADFTFLSFFLAKGDRTDLYETFLFHIKKEVAKTHQMFVLGTNEHNPKRQVLDKITSLKFDTELEEVVMSEFRGAKKIEFDYKNLEVECALL
ncbi:hypothetical protein D6855_05955 [Butyrivibrio sp. CB08]|uniref:hypothetical protein n=1 Tax=Butyrivibrio sp. CB08 TaxID=2364879 RepID=UPI000EA98C6B|nr:hypothetical protein [Butyrivibrio sp. CB08]RKM61436.1 hypothetical protein D6855_05955 [Butyrivibrio sp. CB08]